MCSPNVRGDFRIFSNLLISSQAFTGNFGKNVGKIGEFTNEIVTQKEHTVKSTLAKRKASGFSRRQNLCRHSLFDQAVFDFDAVQLFQHGFGGDENEDYCGGGMDQVHGKAGHIVSFQHFPIECLGIVHQRSCGVHDAAVDDYGHKCAKGGKAATSRVGGILFDKTRNIPCASFPARACGRCNKKHLSYG